jgi:hypothetical protein
MRVFLTRSIWSVRILIGDATAREDRTVAGASSFISPFLYESIEEYNTDKYRSIYSSISRNLKLYFSVISSRRI